MTPIKQSSVSSKGFRQIKKNPVKLTALLYLREALLAENYEECPVFIQIARDFGAQNFEIINLLEAPNRVPRG